MKILLSLPEFPFAHHGGAARSMRTIMEFMASYGHACRAIATTATVDLYAVQSAPQNDSFQIVFDGMERIPI